MKKSITDTELRADFAALVDHRRDIPASVIYSLSVQLLGQARAEACKTTAVSFQFFIASMVDMCHKVPVPPRGSERLLTDEGLEALYTRDVSTSDISCYLMAVVSAAGTGLQNAESEQERIYAQGLWTAHATFLHALAQYVNAQKGPERSSDS